MKPKTFPPRRALIRSQDEPFIMEVPVISSGHFSPADLETLYDKEQAMAVSDDGDFTLIYIEEYEDYNLSPEGAALLKHLAELGYFYLRISAEVGDTVAGFPTFTEPEPCNPQPEPAPEP